MFLDAGPLSLVTNPNQSEQSLSCTKWLQDQLFKGSHVILPEIADYEVRRELIRAQKIAGLSRLDALTRSVEYLPLTTAAMRQAALFWAKARQTGRPTAGDRTIDADMILAGQLATYGESKAIIATTNVGHLSQYVAAAIWQDIGE